MTTPISAKVPILDPTTDALPDKYAPPSIATNATAAVNAAAAAAVSESNAATSATSAATSESNASTSATSADQSASAASTSASDAANSATTATAEATAASQSATDAAASAAAVGAVATRLQYTGVAWYEAGATNPDTYATTDATGVDTAALVGNTGYDRQAAGTAALPAAQSRMRRCVVANDGSKVVYYLDCDDSTKIAGTWDGTTQTGWVRVYEGALDPVKTTPGQTAAPSEALRAGVGPWASNATYASGDRVTYDGYLWDSLCDDNTGVTPASGTSTADLTGAAGQVMVEIPAFYYRMDYDPSAHRHAWATVFDASRYRLFPNLGAAATAPATVNIGARSFALHPWFTKAGVQRPARYAAAFLAIATDTGNNTAGTLQSVADGTTTNTTSISNTNFRVKTQNRNTGLTDLSGNADNVWSLGSYWARHAQLLLYVTEYRTLYSQWVIGGGNTAGSAYNKICGRTAPMGNSTGVTDATGAAQTPTTGEFDAMTWRGIEDWYGTAYRWLDGWNLRNDTSGLQHFVSATPSDWAYNTATGYTLIATSPTGADAWQYPDALVPGTFLCSAVGGSSGTYLTDGYYANDLTDESWRVPRVGGAADSGSNAGAAALSAADGAGVAHVDRGAALIL